MKQNSGLNAQARKRRIAHGSEWWVRLFVVAVVVGVWLRAQWWVGFPIYAVLLVLSFVRAPWDPDRKPVDVAVPVRGRWVAINSPATKVPSHGIRAYGQTYAVDILHPRPPGTAPGYAWGLGMRRPEAFDTFGEPVHAAADGVVVAASDRSRDHRSRESWWALAYLYVVEAFVRQLGGGRFVLGNHVVVDQGGGVFATYAHLRRGSLVVRPGDRVATGQRLGLVGNSGNTSEPHLHFQLTDDAHLPGAAGIPFRWQGVTIRPGDTDPSWSSKPVSAAIVAGVPADGQVFEAAPGVPHRIRAS